MGRATLARRLSGEEVARWTGAQALVLEEEEALGAFKTVAGRGARARCTRRIAYLAFALAQMEARFTGRALCIRASALLAVRGTCLARSSLTGVFSRTAGSHACPVLQEIRLAALGAGGGGGGGRAHITEGISTGLAARRSKSLT